MLPTPEEIREMEHQHIKMSYNKIEELIYAGNNMCCQGHFEQELLSKGITADISLEAEGLDNPQGVNYFFWFPWQEDTAPPLELINLALKVVDDLMAQNIKTYIHCKNGHGRTTTFLAFYFMRKKGLGVDEALALVKQRRPSMHLNEIQKAFLRDFKK
ncbi:MAG: dual specificity protein phosphatase family protein [Omnitrophica bacterium]|nr:dual specificity protein phosphatase family protein [Candidatus Omnitrophota bacterium]